MPEPWTLPHLHLQVQTHVDVWDPENLSVPFAFDKDGRAPVRNDRIYGGNIGNGNRKNNGPKGVLWGVRPIGMA